MVWRGPSLHKDHRSRSSSNLKCRSLPGLRTAAKKEKSACLNRLDTLHNGKQEWNNTLSMLSIIDSQRCFEVMVQSGVSRRGDAPKTCHDHYGHSTANGLKVTWMFLCWKFGLQHFQPMWRENGYLLDLGKNASKKQHRNHECIFCARQLIGLYKSLKQRIAMYGIQ